LDIIAFTAVIAESTEIVPAKYNFSGSLYPSVLSFAISYSALIVLSDGALDSNTK